MTPESWALDAAEEAAIRLGNHPQDHGWRNLYRLFAYGISHGAPELSRLVLTWQSSRPAETATHLVTLLGIALKRIAGTAVPHLAGDGPMEHRLRSLERLLAAHSAELHAVLGERRNSFTGARRYLVAQVLLAAYFGRSGHDCVFADLGTGLGLLPRQLNSRRSFERHRHELPWHAGVPRFVEIPLGRRFGVDRGPLPDFEWVRSCYGPSAYYDALFTDLRECEAMVDCDPSVVEYHELNLLDRAALAAFVRGHGVNAVNLSYVLYQLDPATRVATIEALRGWLEPPGFVMVVEPRAELGHAGCSVTVYEHHRPDPWHVCDVSDGHFRGRVRPGADFAAFAARYPVALEPPGSVVPFNLAAA